MCLPQVTNPNCPLSFGVSLKNLSLQVTLQNISPVRVSYVPFSNQCALNQQLMCLLNYIKIGKV